ncbi:hypothetical protein [Candidatus Oleimmundimicrobium sp.]|nr:hypothetical protein [Candidatus Oleimmundimicrobium sp.]MDO8885803.1 hypothetical protein [Candidatus Oleimmundimicrobium sp.]
MNREIIAESLEYRVENKIRVMGKVKRCEQLSAARHQENQKELCC